MENRKKLINNILNQHVGYSQSIGRRRWQEQQRHKKLRLSAFVALLLIIVVVAGIAFAFQGIKSPSTPLVVAGKTITVRRGGNFQTALNQAVAGDTIVLEAGAEFIGSFELPNKSGAEFVTVQSSELAKLPPENVRVQPKDQSLMPKVLSPGKGAAALLTSPAAHHYRFVGIEFGVVNDDYVYNLIALGTGDQKAAEMPSFIEFDRCSIHSRGLNKTRRGLALNSSDTVIKNSYIAGFAGAGDETQAIAGWNGAGRYKIINNYLEGGAENVLFGGGDPSVPNLVPSDIEIRGNLLTKPLEWREKATQKYTLELKNARRVTIADNIIENCWNCTLIGLTVRNQDGTAPWSTIEDVTIHNNLIRRASSAINLLGADDGQKSLRLKRLKIINNLIEEIDSAKWGDGSGGGYFVQTTDTEAVEVVYNTAVKVSGNVLKAYGKPNTNFIFRYNVVSFNDYGFWREHENALTGGIITGNIVINNKAVSVSDFVVPQGNFALQLFPQVGFVNWKEGDYRLSATSRFKGKAENDKDIGCDIAALMTAVTAAQTGKLPDAAVR